MDTVQQRLKKRGSVRCLGISPRSGLISCSFAIQRTGGELVFLFGETAFEHFGSAWVRSKVELLNVAHQSAAHGLEARTVRILRVALFSHNF